MLTKQILRGGLLTAAAVAFEAKSNDDPGCRPSELPIYSSKETEKKTSQETIQVEPGKLEGTIRDVRQIVTKYVNEVSAYKRVGVEHFDRAVEDLDWLIDYLRKEDNTLPKAGAIGIGGMTGFIFGLRGGFIKRTLYATTGVLAMAAVCYPKEAAEYSQIGLVESKKYLTIAYNFAYGVKKDDPPLELPSLPTVPTNFSDLWNTIKSSASSLISDNQEKVPEIIHKVEEKVPKS